MFSMNDAFRSVAHYPVIKGRDYIFAARTRKIAYLIEVDVQTTDRQYDLTSDNPEFIYYVPNTLYFLVPSTTNFIDIVNIENPSLSSTVSLNHRNSGSTMQINFHY